MLLSLTNWFALCLTNFSIIFLQDPTQQRKVGPSLAQCCKLGHRLAAWHPMLAQTYAIVGSQAYCITILGQLCEKIGCQPMKKVFKETSEVWIREIDVEKMIYIANILLPCNFSPYYYPTVAQCWPNWVNHLHIMWKKFQVDSIFFI